MKKILLVATVQSHVCQFHRPLAAMLHRHECEIHVAARNNLAEKNGLKLNFVEKTFDVPFQRSPFAPANLKAYRMLKKIIDEGKYDIVHCNTPVGGVLGRFAARTARKHGTKVFYTAHGFHFYKGAPLKNWLIWYPVEIFMSRYTNKLLTITEEDYRLAKGQFNTEVIRTHGVGANSSKFYPLPSEECTRLKKEIGYEKDTKLILCTGELNRNKNQITAIRAIKLVVEKFPKVKLLLAGNGPSLQDLKNAVHELDMDKYVDFLSYRPDLERFVNISDIVFSCSLREGLPMNIVEGMLCGKPVVASDNRGHRELIRNGENGFLIPVQNAESAAKTILDILQNPDAKVLLKQNMLSTGLQYSDKTVQKELEQVYGF